METHYLYHPKIQSILRKSKVWRNFCSFESLVVYLNQIVSPDFLQECAHAAKKWEINILRKIPQLEFVTIFEPSYPKLLKEIYDPPFVLACLGDISLLSKNLISIVGTRKASSISLKATEALVESLKLTKDLGIVSGMALGIDRKAFESALNYQIPVMGVLGTTIDLEYPPGNRDLYKRVKSNPRNLIISEFIMQTEPAKWTFPKRNRVIAGLSARIYIMESGRKSGTISTASSGVDENREIYVFDHPKQFDNSGGKKLIREGAFELKIQILDNLNNSSLYDSNSEEQGDSNPKTCHSSEEMQNVISFEDWRNQIHNFNL